MAFRVPIPSLWFSLCHLYAVKSEYKQCTLTTGGVNRPLLRADTFNSILLKSTPDLWNGYFSSSCTQQRHNTSPCFHLCDGMNCGTHYGWHPSKDDLKAYALCPLLSVLYICVIQLRKSSHTIACKKRKNNYCITTRPEKNEYTRG